MTEFDCIVVGGGLAGSSAALALAQSGLSVGFVAPRGGPRDGRTTALLKPSIATLERLGAWPAVADRAAPMRTLRIVDGSKRLIRAPIVSFNASEIDEDAFGQNVANADLLDALDETVAQIDAISRFDSHAASMDIKPDAVRIGLGDGKTVTAALVVGADGRHSVVRQAAGINARSWSYPQSAIVLTFTHTLTHEGISTEFHTESGPFTQVPLQGKRSSLVWVVDPAEVGRIENLDGDALNREIEDRMQSMLGAVSVDSPLQSFPLSGMVAESFGSGPIALVGEAAHVFPPIGAQGLNLGLRDVEDLARHCAGAFDRKTAEQSVKRYASARRLDVTSRTAGVDILNRSLLSDLLPVQLARAAGLSLLSMPGPLRSIAIREGMVPGSSMREVARSLNPFGSKRRVGLREKIRRQTTGRDRI